VLYKTKFNKYVLMCIVSNKKHATLDLGFISTKLTDFLNSFTVGLPCNKFKAWPTVRTAP